MLSLFLGLVFALSKLTKNAKKKYLYVWKTQRVAEMQENLNWKTPAMHEKIKKYTFIALIFHVISFDIFFSP